MADSAPEQSPDRTEAFLRLLGEHERRLAIYVTGLVSCPQDAQDILQEGKIVMWRHFEKFELGTNFPAWGRKILFHQILAYRKRSKRDPLPLLSEETLEMLNDEAENAIREKRWVDREKALEVCLQKMSADHRQILEMRYRDETPIDKIARQVERTEGAVYRLLSRLRISLYDCVEETRAQNSTG